MVKTLEQFETLTDEQLATVEGGTDWGNAAKGAGFGAGLGIGLCSAAGVITAGTSWAVTGACGWAGAKIGGAITIIADNLVK